MSPPPPPPARFYSEGLIIGGFLRFEFGKLIYGGVYFQNFTIYEVPKIIVWVVHFLKN